MKDRIHVASDNKIFRLPNLIKLENTAEGEAAFMKRKKIPNAIRIHNVQDKNSHEWLYSQCLLYHPFKNEIKDMKAARESKDECQRLFLHSETPDSFEENGDNISKSDVIKVRRKVMPFIEDIQEAREKIAIMNTERIGDEIDAAIEQENEECNIIGDELHPDYEVHHPDFFMRETYHQNLVLHRTKRLIYGTKRKSELRFEDWIPIRDMS